MTLPIRNSRIRLSQGQLFWREVGLGKTVVFLHGSWSDGSEWDPVIQPLSSQYHCIALDLLGFGDSEHPNCHYSTSLEADCLAEYLDALRLRDIWLVGDSLGAWVAIRFALMYPDRVNGLILINPEGVDVPELRRWGWAKALTTTPPLLAWILRWIRPVAQVMKRHASIDRLLKLRHQLRRSPTACKLLFKRRRAELQAELVQDELPTLQLPILLLEPDQSDRPAQRRNQIYEGVLQQSRKPLVAKDSEEYPLHVAEQVQTFISTAVIAKPNKPNMESESPESLHETVPPSQ